MRLGVAGGEPVDQARRVEPKVVVKDHSHRNGRVGRNVAIGFRLVDHDPRGIVAETSHVVMHGVAVLESLGVFQIKPEAKVTGDSQSRLEPGPGLIEAREIAAGLSAADLGMSQWLVRQTLELECGSFECAELGQARARSWGAQPVYSGATSLIASDFTAGGGTTATAISRIDVESSPAATEKWKGLIDRLDPSPELAPFKRPKRLTGLLAVGEAIDRFRAVRYLVAGPDLNRQRKRIPASDLEGGLAVVQNEMGLTRPACRSKGNKQACSGQSATVPARRRAINRRSKDTHGGGQRPNHRLWLDHLAKVDRAGFLDGLANRGLTQGR